MDKEQEINEMAVAIADFTVRDGSMSSRKLADNLYELGYRKLDGEGSREVMHIKSKCRKLG